MITKIDQEKCKGCGVCIDICPADIIRFNEHKKAVIAYTDDCMTCYLCERNCAHQAIFVHPFKELLPDCF